MDEKFPDRIDSKFRYVLLASARAEQMMRGARSLVETTGRKPTTVAMAEVTADVIDWGYGPSPSLEEEELVMDVMSADGGEEEEVH